jgi:CubicO group peptidase (beta-lactamase class C family)
MPTGFGLGFIGPLMMPPGVGGKSFGHAGAGGSLAFADPDARLSFGYVMNQMQLGMTGDQRTQTLVAAAYASLE